jgi:hypothetical protein
MRSRAVNGDAVGKWLFALFGSVGIALLLWGGNQLQKLPVIEYRLSRIEEQLQHLTDEGDKQATEIARELRP